MIVISNLGLSDGFWGALFGALITGMAGIIVITMQLRQRTRDLNHESKKEIRHVVYFSDKYVNKFEEVICIRERIEQSKHEILGHKVVGADSLGGLLIEEVSPNEEMSPKQLEEFIQDFNDLTLPRRIKECKQISSKIKNVNLNAIRYKQFENVLKIIDKIESITNKDYKTNTTEELNRKRNEINSLIKKLEKGIKLVKK